MDDGRWTMGCGDCGNCGNCHYCDIIVHRPSSIVPLGGAAPLLALDLLGPQPAQQHRKGGALVLRVILQALALEVLHQVKLAVVFAHFRERL